MWNVTIFSSRLIRWAFLLRHEMYMIISDIDYDNIDNCNNIYNLCIFLFSICFALGFSFQSLFVTDFKKKNREYYYRVILFLYVNSLNLIFVKCLFFSWMLEDANENFLHKNQNMFNVLTFALIKSYQIQHDKGK